MSSSSKISVKKFILIGLPVMLVVSSLLMLFSAYWLLNTSSGASWLWNKLEGLEVVDVESSRVSGDLASGFIVDGMAYRSENLDLMVGQAEIEAGLILWPLKIRVERLLLKDVDVYTRSSKVSDAVKENGVDIRDTLDGFSLPLPLEVQEAVFTGISLQQDDKPRVGVAETVSFKAALDEQLVIDYLDILTTDIEARLQGNFGFEAPFRLSATLDGRFENIDEAGQAIVESSGDLEKLQIKLTSQKFGLQLDGELFEVASNPNWSIQALLDRLQWPQDQGEQVITLSGLNLTSRGSIENWSLVLNSGLDSAQLQGIHLALSGSGSASSAEISDATLTGPGLDLGFIGSLDWSRQTAAGVKAVIRQLDLSPWLADWPAGEKLAGNLELNWSDDGLEIPASQVTVVGTELMAAIEADIDIESNNVNGRLDWSNLSWPLNSTSTLFASESGQLHLSGSIDEWQANGQLNVQLGDYPQGFFKIQGSGDRSSARLDVPGGEVLGGTLSGKMTTDWSGELQLNASIQTRGIDPEPLLPGWPGRLDSDFEISVQNQPAQVQVNLFSLQGSLRDVPISAHGGLDVGSSSLAFHSLELRTDEAILELNGATDTPAGLLLKFNGNLPSGLLQGARGNLEFKGRYSDYDSQPSLELEMQGRDLFWNELGISNLSASIPEMGSATTLPALQLHATGLRVNDFELEEFSLNSSPVGDQLELKANLLSEDITLDGVMNLESKDRNDLLGGEWQGELTDLELAIGPAYLFKLSEPAILAWSPESVSLGPVCLSENESAALCLGFDLQSNGDWSLVADAAAVPLNYLRDYLDLDIHLEQLVEGRLEWRQPRGRSPTGGADFHITAGRVLDLVDNDVLTQTDEGRFAFALRNGNLESGVLDLAMPGTGFIDVDFDVLDIMVGGAQKIQGRAIAQLDHFKLAGQLALPGVDEADGQFKSDILLSGSVSDPEFDGTFKLTNGLVHYTPIGLQLEDIEFEGQVKKRDTGDFKGQFRAGEGIATFDGRFQFDDIGSPKLEINLAGDQLLMVNTDELKVLTETDLELMIGPKRIDIDGRVLIPSAMLSPSNLQLGGARDSEDLVIENAGFETAPAGAEASGKSRVHGQLEVSLGDDVVIEVPGVKTNITGSTIFNWNGDSIPIAEGGYTLRGTVDVYGPRLSISNGSISFPSVPANNPNLNIRAGRDIFGNTQIRRAGVRVTGNLTRPKLEAYTVPVTTEDRAWTLLITGTDFDQGQGINGFDVGTYIAPRLYVSYGISLFDDENVFSVRYDLDRGFGVKVTSGQRETGLDVSYTIDK